MLPWGECAEVFRMTTAATTNSDRLGIVYPDTDHMAENTLQRLIAEFLRPLLERFLREATEGSLAKKKRYHPLRAHLPCRVGADQFWYYRERNPKKCVSPDVYVIAGAEPTSAPPSWLLWQLKAPPLFALEIVSQDVSKDYDLALQAYQDTGVRELVVFDPDAPKLSDASQGRPRVRWQVYRRDGRGRLVSVEQSNADRVKCEALCCWLRVVGTGELRLLRIGVGVGGEELFLSAEEYERAEKERERAEKERERAEKEQALALVASERQALEREQQARKELEILVQKLLAERDKPRRKKSRT